MKEIFISPLTEHFCLQIYNPVEKRILILSQNNVQYKVSFTAHAH
jgi:hypothetical protein